MAKEVKPVKIKKQIIATMGQPMHSSTREKAFKLMVSERKLGRLKRMLKARGGGIFGLGLIASSIGSSIKEAQKK